MSTILGPTFDQIRAQVRLLKDRLRDGQQVVGLRSSMNYSGPTTGQDGNELLDIVPCDSALAVRLALRKPIPPNTTRVLLTGLDDKDLSEDIKLRLPKRRLFDLNAWDIVRSHFQAREVAPELSRNGWIADVLLESMPLGGYQPAMAGYLSPETVFPQLLGIRWGLKDNPPDLTSLMLWSMQLHAHDVLAQSTDEFRKAATDWLQTTAGIVAPALIGLVTRINGTNGLVMGLALQVLFHPDAKGNLERAVGKLEERYFAGKLPGADVLQRWVQGAEEALIPLKALGEKAYQIQMEKADNLLLELQTEPMMHLGTVTPLSLKKRIERATTKLGQIVTDGRWSDIPSLEPLVELVRAHRWIEGRTEAREKLDMALRLGRWLADEHAHPVTQWKTVSAAAHWHLRDGGRIDLAMKRLNEGSGIQSSAAVASVIMGVAQKLEEISKSFAKLLAEWTLAGGDDSSLMGVELVLDRVVMPLLKAKQNVLFVVVDGMSAAVAHELVDDLCQRDWDAYCPAGHANMPAVLAVIPSVTEYSRTSLLTGSLKRGNSPDEKDGFANHAGLLAHCKTNHPPVLFHKGNLNGSNLQGVDSEIMKAIQNDSNRIVGVVLNAVDDNLLKGDQVRVRWERRSIVGLEALLEMAAENKRVVVLASDHGHVLEQGTVEKPGDGGERWRQGSNAPTADEILIQGQRVLAPNNRMVGPFTNKVRYGVKRNGYHGGLTPQEMVAPLVVLHRPETKIEGWISLPSNIPGWWDNPLAANGAGNQENTAKVNGQRELFVPPQVLPPADTPATETPHWVKTLVSSDIYKQQVQLTRRAGLSTEIVARLLTALDERGGKLTVSAMARAANQPEARVPGLVSVLQRLLNIDGSMVLNRDEQLSTIVLNVALLKNQFGLEA